jgi:hypothetical protein
MDDAIPAEIVFSWAMRGQFYVPGAKLNLPRFRTSLNPITRRHHLSQTTQNANDLSPLSIGDVAQRIRLVRGQRVVLDADLAAFYGETTKRFN